LRVCFRISSRESKATILRRISLSNAVLLVQEMEKVHELFYSLLVLLPICSAYADEDGTRFDCTVNLDNHFLNDITSINAVENIIGKRDPGLVRIQTEYWCTYNYRFFNLPKKII